MKTFWMKTALILAASALWIMPHVAAAQSEEQYTEISASGRSLYRVAVPPLVTDGVNSASSQKIRQVLVNDLGLSGLFKVLDPRGFLGNLQREGLGVDAPAWTNVGAQAVVKARVTSIGGQTRVDWYLYDLGRGSAPVLTKNYSGADLRRLAHQFANDVVFYYTHEAGVFTTRIAFSLRGRVGTSQIEVIDMDGYGARRVSRTGDQNILPDWSPDGLIAYTSFLWRNPDLYVVGLGNERASRIAKYPGLNSGAAWSPDGKQIALTLSKDGNSELYVIDRSGKILRRLTRNNFIDTSPTWSPDGSQIAFVSNRGGSPQVYVMSSSGASPRRLTFSGNYNQEPAWCPRKENPVVAFTGRDAAGAYDIFTVNVQNGQIKRLTQGQGSNKSAAWAPNGRLIAYTSSHGGLWIMTDEGFNQRQIFRGTVETPSWSW